MLYDDDDDDDDDNGMQLIAEKGLKMKMEEGEGR
jgi:hypothetical protein